MNLCWTNVLIFTLSATRFEPDGSSLRRRMYNRLLENEPSDLKHVAETVKIKILVHRRWILLVYIIRTLCIFVQLDILLHRKWTPYTKVQEDKVLRTLIGAKRDTICACGRNECANT
jgi:hypothetical protein